LFFFGYLLLSVVELPEDFENEEEEKKIQQQHRMPSAFDLIDSGSGGGSGVQIDVSSFLLSNSL